MVRFFVESGATDNVLRDDDARDDDHSEHESHGKWQA